MNKNLKLFSLVLGISLSMVALIAGCGFSQVPVVNRQLNPAPDISLNDVYDRPFRLSENRGKVVVINFWASTCPPCILEMPEFQAVHEKLGDKVVMLSISAQDSESYIRDFMLKRGYTWLFAADRTGANTLAYGIGYYPTTIIVDARGRMAVTQVGGPLSRAFLESAIDKVSALE